MSRVRFSLSRLMVGVAMTALACFATRFTWNFARWILLPSLVLLLIAAWILLLTSGRSRVAARQGTAQASWAGKRTDGRLLAGLTLGGAVGWLLEMFGLVLVDGGEGTYVPLVAFLAPILLPELLAPSFVSDTASTVLLVVAPLLFCSYGVAVVSATSRGWGSACFAAIVVLHHITAAVAFWFSPLSDVDLTLQKAFTLRPWWVIASALFFGGIHVATLGVLFVWQRRNGGTRRANP